VAFVALCLRPGSKQARDVFREAMLSADESVRTSAFRCATAEQFSLAVGREDISQIANDRIRQASRDELIGPSSAFFFTYGAVLYAERMQAFVCSASKEASKWELDLSWSTRTPLGMSIVLDWVEGHASPERACYWGVTRCGPMLSEAFVRGLCERMKDSSSPFCRLASVLMSRRSTVEFSRRVCKHVASSEMDPAILGVCADFLKFYDGAA